MIVDIVVRRFSVVFLSWLGGLIVFTYILIHPCSVGVAIATFLGSQRVVGVISFVFNCRNI